MHRLMGIFLSLFLNFDINNYEVSCTIDVNLAVLKYLAAHLDPPECRRLIAALHYTTYELPQSIDGAERKVDDEIPCLRQLLHWNGSEGEGRGRTHEAIEHRLRQLKRNDLADWLGKTTFKQLGTDLERSIDGAFGKIGEQETETTYPITLNPPDEVQEEDSWVPIDTIMMAILVALIATLVAVLGMIIVHQVKLHRHEKKRKDSTVEEGTVQKVPKSHKTKTKQSKNKKKTNERNTRTGVEVQTESEMDEERAMKKNRVKRRKVSCGFCNVS